ncbi:MAG: PBP1A family penicillin-binding protein [Xanthomonadaceae bacterium]|nr:PBP1A family penicillin-binding protein [Xanthomonadaceae bacterium]
MLGSLAVLGVYLYVAPSLPSVEVLKDVRLQEPMRVYTRDGRLVAEFGEQKRRPLAWTDMPPRVVSAFLAAEDDRFFQHPGVDYQGLTRAVVNHLVTGDRSQGGGTITMQLTREFFLSREKTYIRKIREIFLAFRIEHELTKEEILTLYLNKIFLGNRAYGVAAASRVYFDTDAHDLTIAQAAALAATAQRPSATNPVSNTPRLLERRAYVLGRLRNLDWISASEYQEAMAEPLVARVHGLGAEVEAPYVAEMVRAEMLRQYGTVAYEGGLRVYASIDSESQAAANRALRLALHDFDFRHGYRGPAGHHEIGEDIDEGEWDRIVAAVRAPGLVTSALVVEVGEQSARVYLGGGRYQELPWAALEWARRVVNGVRGPVPQTAAEVVARGDLVHLLDLGRGEGWRLAQVPHVQGALYALDVYDGGIRALVGGYDFYASQYNRSVQASRQPGSSFKPFIYSAALERGFTAASVVNDAPVVFEEDEALERDWRPRNDSGRFYGPTRLRDALTYSRNLVSIRVMRAVGVPYTVNYMQRFGFERGRLPRDLSLSLGSAVVSPAEMATGFATFANGGFRIEPWLVLRVEDGNGVVLYEADPPRACAECERVVVEQEEPELPPLAERVISAENAFLIDSMLRDVVARGTGRRALELGRSDLAGKTGSTNDHTDAWFVGYAGGISAAAWVGFDSNDPLGDGEFGGRAALPMWIEYMGAATAGRPESPQLQPPGLVTVRISRETGRLATAADSDAMLEYFRSEDLERMEEEARAALQRGDDDEDRERDDTILF